MPVVLPPEPGADSDPPRPPGAIAWIALFAVFMVGGVVIALLTWPKSEPTNTPWFWVRLLVLWSSPLKHRTQSPTYNNG